MTGLAAGVTALMCLLTLWPVQAQAAELPIQSRAALLMEKTTGQVLYARNEHEQLEPASVTKIMTLLLTMEAIDSGTIGYDDVVTVSAYAAGMGGSQVYLAEGEQITVEELLKAVCVASGGQNNQEPTTEARCIRDTLVSMGIAPGRIYLEDASTSTEENLAFSAEVIRREGLPTEVAIASDNFHQLRAGVWAEKDGLTPYSLGCASIWMLGPGYWAREAAALLYMGATGAL